MAQLPHQYNWHKYLIFMTKITLTNGVLELK